MRVCTGVDRDGELLLLLLLSALAPATRALFDRLFRATRAPRHDYDHGHDHADDDDVYYTLTLIGDAGVMATLNPSKSSTSNSSDSSSTSSS